MKKPIIKSCQNFEVVVSHSYTYTVPHRSFSLSIHSPPPSLQDKATARMAETGTGKCTGCCCRFIFTSGLAALFLWLSLRTYNPTISIQQFYLPALNRTHNSTNNHTLYFDLKLQNKMKDKGVRYANINLTFFYYGQNNSRLPAANYTVLGFHQGHDKKAHRKVLVPASELPWAAAIDAVSNGSTVSFRVNLATRVKFKIVFWYTKSSSLVVGGDVAVDRSGEKVKKKGIKLKSGAPDLRSQWERVGVAAVYGFLLVLLL